MREAELKELEQLTGISQRVYDAITKVEGRRRDSLILTFVAHILMRMPDDLREVWLRDLEEAAAERASALSVAELHEPSKKNV